LFLLYDVNKKMEALKIDRTKLFTQADYARKIKKSRAWVNQQVKSGDIKSIEINGAVLVYTG
jgi:hypothetical protein